MSPTVTTRPVSASDLAAIRSLHARVFGPGRFVRTAYRVREGTADLSPFCRVALAGGRIIAALRLTEVTIGGAARALLLGPLAVDPEYAGQGYGRQLVGEALDAARGAGVALVVLVGDEPYYGRFGFVPIAPGRITLPGPVNPARLLAVELQPRALERMQGLVRAASG